MKFNVWLLLAILATPLLSFNLQAAVDMFLKIEDIKGESQHPGHEDEIDILAWSWGTSHTSKQKMNRPTRYAKTATNMDMTFTKNMDSSSSELFKACNNGKHFKDVTITVVNPDRTFEPYIHIHFFDVTCISYRVSGSGGDAVPTEEVSFNYSKIQFEYKEQKDDGSQGGNVELGYDLSKNKKA